MLSSGEPPLRCVKCLRRNGFHTMSETSKESNIKKTYGDFVPKLVSLTEVITHLAFYAGWPKAMSALTVARQIFNSES
jgi:hypothetical protein